jgi:hypothetical protein
LGKYILAPKQCLTVDGRSGYFWHQNGTLLRRADLSLGKLILAPKWHLRVEVGSGFQDPTIVRDGDQDSGLDLLDQMVKIEKSVYNKVL